jgi:DNA-binding response OmpR family regulator
LHCAQSPEAGARIMPRILTIEDDELIAHDIVRTLSASGFSVDVARTGREGMAKVMAGDYDVVTLDRMLPDLDGLTIVATMRGVGMETPVLVMSAMSDVDQRIQGLRAGGDDYLTKPFSPDEMFARVEVLLRRRPRHAKAETLLRNGALELDLVRRKVTHRQRELDLQPTEFRVLEFMMRHTGQVLTRTMIFEAVWGCRFDPGTNLIDVHVGRLRKKVEMPGERPLIRTIRGSGYLFG